MGLLVFGDMNFCYLTYDNQYFSVNILGKRKMYEYFCICL